MRCYDSHERLSLRLKNFTTKDHLLRGPRSKSRDVVRSGRLGTIMMTSLGILEPQCTHDFLPRTLELLLMYHIEIAQEDTILQEFGTRNPLQSSTNASYHVENQI